MIGDLDTFGLKMVLLLGPHEGDGSWSEPQLRRAWSLYRDELMRPTRHGRPGDRPWAHWRFDLNEPQPPTEPERIVRLLELAELAGEELEAVAERALGALHGIEAIGRAEDAGAIFTSPREARERGREQRDRDAAAWREVLEALDD